MSPCANSRLAGQTSLGLPKHSANSRATPLKTGPSPTQLRLSLKKSASARSNVCSGRHRLVLTPRALQARRKHLVTADFASSSPEAIENAELLHTEGWGWGSPTVWQREGGSDAFSRGDATEADHEMLPQRTERATALAER